MRRNIILILWQELHIQRDGKNNLALLFGPTGNIEEIYDKVHLPAEEAAMCFLQVMIIRLLRQDGDGWDS